MKKFTSVLLIFLCLFFSSVKAAPESTTNVFKEGIYQVNTIANLCNIKVIQNISTDSGIYFILLDENQAIIQVIKMTPNSPKYNLYALKPNYKIVLLGNGSAFFS